MILAFNNFNCIDISFICPLYINQMIKINICNNKLQCNCFVPFYTFTTLQQLLQVLYFTMESISSWFQDGLEEQNLCCLSESLFCPDFRLNSQVADSLFQPQIHQLKMDFSESRDVISDNLANSEGQEIEDDDQGGGGRRANNTVFKTSLSQFRKSILDFVKASPSFGFLKREIKSVYGAKNQTIFPKFLSMVRALKKQNQVLSFWNIRKQRLIQKKISLLKAGNYTQKRLSQLQRTIQMMDKSIQEENLQKSFDIYWGNYKQHQKYQKGKLQLIQFDVAFRRLYEKKEERSLRSKKVEAQRGGRRGKCDQFTNRHKIS